MMDKIKLAIAALLWIVLAFILIIGPNNFIRVFDAHSFAVEGLYDERIGNMDSEKEFQMLMFCGGFILGDDHVTCVVFTYRRGSVYEGNSRNQKGIRDS